MAAPNGFPSNYVFSTTFQNRLAAITDTTIRNRVLLMMLQARNRIMPADGGAVLEWEVYMRNPKPTGFNSDVTPEYNMPDSLRNPRLGWAAYHHGLRLDRITIQTNKGKQAFINVVTKCVKEVEQSFSQRWPEYFYQDGDNPPGSEPRPLQGFYTWFNKYVSNTAAAYQGYQGKVRICSGSYATLTMDLGTDSSDWKGPDNYDTVQTTTASLGVTAGQKWWPFGQGDSAYDYWHPLIVNTTATAWGTNPAFDEVYCTKQLDFGIIYSRRVAKGDKGPINLILCSQDPMLTIRSKFEATYRTMAEILPTDPKGQASGMQGRAYATPIYQYSGVYLIDDYDMPNSTDLIGLNLDTVAYRPVSSYNAPSGSFPLMEPYDGEIPGGGGRLIGGFSLGQLQIDSPRNSVLWKPLG